MARYYMYNPDKNLTQDELYVINDLRYAYVSTTNLDPKSRLGKHRHGSANIHYVVEGSLTIRQEDGRTTRHTAPCSIKVAANTMYEGWAGNERCVFVEGHKALSPTTADRFSERETIVEVSSPSQAEFADQWGW